MSTPTRPGWYDDPQDAAQLRYFDGVVWTSHTTPRSTRPAGQAAAAHTGATGADNQGTAAYGHTPQAGGQAPGPPGTWQAPGRQAPGQQQQQPSPHQQQFPGYPQQGGWNQPTYQGLPVGPSTPDGQPLAGYGRRVGAYLIDGLIQLVLVMVLAGWLYVRALGSHFDEFSRALESGGSLPSFSVADVNWGALVAFVVVAAAIQFGYQVFFLSRTGATPGKQAVGISVRLRERPGVPSVGTAARRAALQVVLGLFGFAPGISYVTGLAAVLDLLWPAWDDKRQALHDKLAATNVVVGRQPRG
jgi:uncharacterized RDD family membrane protein YckC